MSLGTKSHALSHGERVAHIPCGAGEGLDLKQSNTSSDATRHLLLKGEGFYAART